MTWRASKSWQRVACSFFRRISMNLKMKIEIFYAKLLFTNHTIYWILYLWDDDVIIIPLGIKTFQFSGQFGWVSEWLVWEVSGSVNVFCPNLLSIPMHWTFQVLWRAFYNMRHYWNKIWGHYCSLIHRHLLRDNILCIGEKSRTLYYNCPITVVNFDFEVILLFFWNKMSSRLLHYFIIDCIKYLSSKALMTNI